MLLCVVLLRCFPYGFVYDDRNSLCGLGLAFPE